MMALQEVKRSLEGVSALFWASSCFAIAVTLGVTLIGAFRPYDAIPDQDLLWLKEGLRLFSSLHVTYPDHPGIYWSLSYAIKAKVLSALQVIQLRPGEAISPEGATTIIVLSRIENGLLIGLAAILTWPISRLLGISKILTSTLVASSSLSLGFLEATAQTRNEITSLIFLQLFTLTIIALARPAPPLVINRKMIAWIALIFFFTSVYCKVQVLLLYPITFALAAAKQSDRFKWEETKRLLGLKIKRAKTLIQGLMIFLLAGWLPWSLAIGGAVFAASNRMGHMRSDIDQPFWIAINIGVFLCTLLASTERVSWKKIWEWIAIYNITTILFARIFAHKLWTSQVFSFPSNSLGFTNTGQKGSSLVQSIHYYTNDLFAGPSALALSLFALLVAIATIGLFRSKNKEISAHWKVNLAILAAVMMTWIANSTRLQGFYEVYIFPITLLSLALIATQNKANILAQNGMRTVAYIVIGLAIFKAVENTKEVRRISNMKQPEDFLCFDQAHDPMLKKLSVSRCRNFKIED